jgi:hypothetical protein
MVPYVSEASIASCTSILRYWDPKEEYWHCNACPRTLAQLPPKPVQPAVTPAPVADPAPVEQPLKSATAPPLIYEKRINGRDVVFFTYNGCEYANTSCGSPDNWYDEGNWVGEELGLKISVAFFDQKRRDRAAEIFGN